MGASDAFVLAQATAAVVGSAISLVLLLLFAHWVREQLRNHPEDSRDAQLSRDLRWAMREQGRTKSKGT